MIKTTEVELVDDIPEDVRVWPEYNEVFYSPDRMKEAKPFIKSIVPFMTTRGFDLLKEHTCLSWDGTFPTSKLSWKFWEWNIIRLIINYKVYFQTNKKNSKYQQIAILSVLIPASDPSRQCRTFPVFAAYLPDKRKETYIEFWNVFLKMAPAEFRFKTCYFDGELTLQSSLDQVFPATRIENFLNELILILSAWLF